jgi:hypothetical protein
MPPVAAIAPPAAATIASAAPPVITVAATIAMPTAKPIAAPIRKPPSDRVCSIGSPSRAAASAASIPHSPFSVAPAQAMAVPAFQLKLFSI